jgi:hypothetical protein
MELDKLVAVTAVDLARQQTELAAEELASWQASPNWADLTAEDRSWFTSEAAELTVVADGTLDGLKKLLSHDYSLHHRLRDLGATVAKKAAEFRAAKSTEPAPGPLLDGETPQAPLTSEVEVLVPKVFRTAKEIDLLIEELTKLRGRLLPSQRVRIIWKEIE